MRESNDATKDFLKSFRAFNENALEVTLERIEFIFSTLRLKGDVYKKSTLISSLAT